MRNTADVTGDKAIAIQSQFISSVSAVDPLVAFYYIPGKKRELVFFYSVPDTPRYFKNIDKKNTCISCLSLKDCGRLIVVRLVNNQTKD
jgi:hypothetical protein